MMTAEELIATHGSAIDAVANVNLEIITISTLSQLLVAMAKEIAAAEIERRSKQ